MKSSPLDYLRADLLFKNESKSYRAERSNVSRALSLMLRGAPQAGESSNLRDESAARVIGDI